jgi:hypothetical protein
MFHSFAQSDSARLQYIGGHSWNFNTNFQPIVETVYDTGFHGDSVCYADSLGLNDQNMENLSPYQIEMMVRGAFNNHRITLVKITRRKNFVWGNYVYSLILSEANLAISNF